MIEKIPLLHFYLKLPVSEQRLVYKVLDRENSIALFLPRIGLQVCGPKMLHSRAIKILYAFNSALDRWRRMVVYTPVSIFAEVPTRLCILQVHKTPWMGTRILGQPLQESIVDCIQSNDINQPGKMPQDDKRERDSAQIIVNTTDRQSYTPTQKLQTR